VDALDPIDRRIERQRQKDRSDQPPDRRLHVEGHDHEQSGDGDHGE